MEFVAEHIGDRRGFVEKDHGYELVTRSLRACSEARTSEGESAIGERERECTMVKGPRR